MKQDLNSLFSNNNYTLKTFYDEHPEFNYYLYRHCKSNELEDFTEKEVIDHWYNNNRDFDFSKIQNFIPNKDVILFLHMAFSNTNGGVTVQYLLASYLDRNGIRCRICNKHDNNSPNSIYNNFYGCDFDMNNTIVIYCEGVLGNPMNAKYIVRWMLSELGKNVPYSCINYYNKNELVYFFNSEIRFYKEDNKDNKFKLLTTFYLNDRIKKYNFENRDGACYTIRKSTCYRSNFNNMHPENSKEISFNTSFEEYIDIFNRYEIFYCYDPLSFLQIISILCGCVCVIYPLTNVSKKRFYQKTGLYEYMKYKNITDIAGIAYGNSEEEILRAKNTIDMAYHQLMEIQEFHKNTQLKSFIHDISNWENNMNNIENIYLNKINNKYNVDGLQYDFYENFYSDINVQNWDKDKMEQHYNVYGKYEGRMINEEDFYSLYPDFDIEFYKEFYMDIKAQNWNKYELMGHYSNFGINEERLSSEKDFFKLHPDFNHEFYENSNPDIKGQGLNKYQLMGHYFHYGRYYTKE